MLQKIRNLPLLAYVAINGFVHDFRKDQRGLSGVVVSVLLILVSVLSVVLIWGFLDGWIQDLWEIIIGNAEEIV